MRKSKSKRFAINDVISGCRVLGIAEESDSTLQLLYAVQFECCGTLSTYTHDALMSRAHHKTTMCKQCAIKAAAATRRAKRESGQQAFKTYAIGEEIGGCRILSIENISQHVQSQTYRTLFLCCNREAIVSHEALHRRYLNKSKFCTECRDKRDRASYNATQEKKRIGLMKREAVVFVTELPARRQPKPKIYASDIERHLAKVFRG